MKTCWNCCLQQNKSSNKNTFNKQAGRQDFKYFHSFIIAFVSGLVTGLWLQPCASDEEDLPSLRSFAFTLRFCNRAFTSKQGYLLLDVPAALHYCSVPGHWRLLWTAENDMKLPLTVKTIGEEVKGTKCLKYSLVFRSTCIFLISFVTGSN